ncbi:MAG: hydrogenase iron-sulfur subunit [Anaerolineales bacterium]|nr:hydrogenase iron-sulfur subunit [Anaerolineales bacterium]
MPGDCHYLEGNLKARRRVERIQSLLDEIGLGAERVRMFNMSAAMASGFTAAAKEMTEQITNLGPNPLKNGG